MAGNKTTTDISSSAVTTATAADFLLDGQIAAVVSDCMRPNKCCRDDDLKQTMAMKNELFITTLLFVVFLRSTPVLP